MRMSVLGSSPLTRGAHLPVLNPSFEPRLIPAHAGSTHPIPGPILARQAHPRSRGEHPERPAEPVPEGGLIPAHAGSTAARVTHFPAPAAHPRSRGEHCGQGDTLSGSCGSSPLTRGALAQTLQEMKVAGLIPAHAGSTRTGWRPSGAESAHPRSRGEHGYRVSGMRVPAGSSPLTRGARNGIGGHHEFTGLIPAHAGSTCRKWRSGHRLGAHPRSRGEHVALVHKHVLKLGSSPLTRGALPRA